MFQVSSDDRERLFQARGAHIEEAATHAARRLYGRSVVAIRVTGERGHSGMFQAYRSVPRRLGGGQSSVGSMFHVR